MPVRAAEASQKDLKRKLARVIRILEDRYGPHIYPEERTLLDQLVFAVLVAGNPVTNARKVLRDFQTDYVDWNEVRVSTIRQLEETFEKARIASKGECAARLKALLERTFHELCRLDLDHLKTAGADAARKFAANLDMLDAWHQQYLLVSAGFEAAPPLDPATERIGERVGIFRADDPAEKRRRILETIVSGVDALRFHHLMVEHGKKLCTPEAPRCARCLVQTECDFFRAESQRKREAARKAPSDPRAQKRPAGGKPAPQPAKTRRASSDEDE